MKKIFLVLSILLALGLSSRFYLLGQKSQKMEMDLGLNQEGNLKPCDKKSHCIETGDIPEEEIPSQLKGPQAHDILKAIAAEAGLVLKKAENGHYHFTHQSQVFGFTDDIEFLIKESSPLQFRSGSRVGHSDLGMNEKRIRDLFSKAKLK